MPIKYVNNIIQQDNTYNVVKPTYKNIEIKKKDTPHKRENEAAKARTRAKLAKVTPANPRQVSIGPYREKTIVDKTSGRLYAAADQRIKDAQDREAAGIVLNALVRPIMPSTGLDIYDAYKRGEVNNVSDALAAPYLTNSWSMRNPGRALATDIVAPFALSKGTQVAKFAGRNIANSWRDMRYALAHPEGQTYGIVPNKIINVRPITNKNYKTASDVEWDAAYNQAINSGNKKEVQRLRDLHFRAKAENYVADGSGSPKRLYRGYGRGEDIEVSPIMKGRDGVWIAEEKEYAGNYTKLNDLVQERDAQGNIIYDHDDWPINEWFEYGNPDYSKVRSYYAKGTVESMLPKRLKHGYERSIYPQISTDLNTPIIEDVRNAAKFMNHDYVNEGRIAAIYDHNYDFTLKDYLNKLKWYPRKVYRLGTADIIKGYDIPIDTEGWYNTTLSVYNVKNPAYVKSANSITYDNKGNIIPLSKRDNFTIKDARYGLIPFTVGTLGFGLYNRR